MATLNVQDIAVGGLNPVYTAVNAADEFPNDGMTYLEVVNGGGVSTIVTIVTQNTSDGLTVTDRTITILATERRKIGPFRKSVYNVQSGASAGRVQVQYSATASVSAGVFRQTPATD
ncbi:MAG: hypothetical protein L0219_07350 [Phycisphaerales bacterium]|nr:hypothetical protein [Phycisphaerales bacterium]